MSKVTGYEYCYDVDSKRKKAFDKALDECVQLDTDRHYSDMGQGSFGTSFIIECFKGLNRFNATAPKVK